MTSQIDTLPKTSSFKNFVKKNFPHTSSFIYSLVLRILSIRYLKDFVFDMRRYSQQQKKHQGFPLKWKYLYPIISDKRDSAGVASGHYFHQDLWMAKKVIAFNPDEHWDVGSRIDGFVAHLLTTRNVKVIDIRKLENKISGLTFIQEDATKLSSIPSNSLSSISSLHAAEHFGLGRYGDPIDSEAYLKFIKSLQRVLKPKGRIYFSVPIGVERVEFNAHRVFDPQTIINGFNELKLVEFAAVNDAGDLVENVSYQNFQKSNFSCGLFIFEK